MSTKLYNGLKADITTLKELKELKRDVQHLVERFYVGKFEEIVSQVYVCYIKALLKSKHASSDIFVYALGSGLGLLFEEDRKQLEKFNEDFERMLRFAESALKDSGIERESPYYYKSMILIAMTEVVSRVIVQYEMGRLSFSDETTRLRDLTKTVFVYPMEDKCLLYPIDASYEKGKERYSLLSEMLKIPQIKDYHYQNNTDMPDDVTLEEWNKRIEDWDTALEVERNSLGFLSFGMKIEADNFSAMPTKSFLFCDEGVDLKERLDYYLKDINDEKIISGIKDDLIFYKEFIEIKSSEAREKQSFRVFFKFRDNIKEYRKKHEYLDAYFKDLL